MQHLILSTINQTPLKSTNHEEEGEQDVLLCAGHNYDEEIDVSRMVATHDRVAKQYLSYGYEEKETLHNSTSYTPLHATTGYV